MEHKFYYDKKEQYFYRTERNIKLFNQKIILFEDIVQDPFILGGKYV
jgi:hypothetical protein